MTRPLARLAVTLLPADVRHRYGDELLELLVRSPRPLADALDELHLAAREHLEVLMRRPLHILSIAALGVSLVVFGYTMNDLTSGLAELPQHWWSSSAGAAVIASGAAVLVTRPRLHGTRAPTR
ncbi:MAG: hypothetical protein ACRD0V_06250 [Acidimicrobiales bacterium]